MENPVLADRLSRGMTQAEYAEFLGFGNVFSGVRQVQRWEHGGVRTVNALSRLCGATGRRPGFFNPAFAGLDEAGAAPELSEELKRFVYEAIAETLLAKAEASAVREMVA